MIFKLQRYETYDIDGNIKYTNIEYFYFIIID